MESIHFSNDIIASKVQRYRLGANGNRSVFFLLADTLLQRHSMTSFPF
jgi:hypothetical protein